jgi:hypothetical protein
MMRKALAAVLAGTLGIGQAAAEGHWRLTGLFGAGESWDDNIFSSPTKPERDMVSRLSPGLDLGYRSTPFSITGRYRLEAEVFRDHPELSSARAGQDGSLEMEYLSGGGVRLAARQGYTETRTPSELSPLAGLDLGRGHAERLASDETLVWQMGPRTESTLAYSFARDNLDRGLHGASHIGSFRLERKLGGRDALRLGYVLRHFTFYGSAPDATAQLPTLGWVHDLGSHTRFEVTAGPRFGTGPVEPEGEASLRHRMRRGELALSAAQTQLLVAGFAAPVKTQSAIVSLMVEPWRDVRVGLSPGAYRTQMGSSTATDWRLGVDLAYRVARWLSFEASEQLSRQRGILGSTALQQAQLNHNVVSVRFSLALPEHERPRAPEGSERRTPGSPRRPLPKPEDETPETEGPQSEQQR